MAVVNLQLVLDQARSYLHDYGPQRAITSITNATPPVVTCTAHGFNDGAMVYITGTSISAYNGAFQLGYVDANTFNLTGVSAAGAATGGVAQSGGETWQNGPLLPHFSEPYRRMFRCLNGPSKRVQRVVYIDLPPYNTIIVPSAYGLLDLAEPSLLEERALVGSVAITSTDTSTPIKVTATAHGQTTGTKVYVTNVAGTAAPWGRWFITVIDANTFSLNGSVSDGVAGTGGIAILNGGLAFTPMLPTDFAADLDGQPGTYLKTYMWINEQIQLRGSVQAVQVRITYWASGTPPMNPKTTIGIDDCADFLACATAANAARANVWFQLADQLKFTAYGQEQEANGIGGLLGEFLVSQVRAAQRGPQKRKRPFRDRVSRWGGFVLPLS
jgi:hypothetical protein